MLEGKNLGSTISARCPKCRALCRWDVYYGQTDLGLPAATFEFWCEGDECNWNPHRRVAMPYSTTSPTTLRDSPRVGGILDM